MTGLGTVQTMVLELHLRGYHPTMQSRLMLELLTPSEKKVFRDHFPSCGRYLRKGKLDRVLEELLQEVTHLPVAAFARLGMIFQVRALRSNVLGVEVPTPWSRPPGGASWKLWSCCSYLLDNTHSIC